MAKPRNKRISYGDIFDVEMLSYYQTHIVDFVYDIIFQNDPDLYLSDQQVEFLTAIQNNDRVAAKSGKGIGKAQPIDTVISTPNGEKKFSELKIGDFVFGLDGKPTKIIGIYPQGIKDTFRVVFDDESSTECCKEHLWAVKGRQDRRKNKDFQVRSLEELMNIGIRVGGKLRFRQWEIPKNKAVEFDYTPVGLDPYTLGVWLGDGTRNQGEITSPDIEIIEYLRKRGETVKQSNYDKIRWKIDDLYSKLKKINLIDKYSYERFIPNCYKYNSIEIREEILRGIMDTDGYIRSSGGAEFLSTSKKLVEDVAYLFRSLGHKVGKIAIKKPFYKGKNGEKILCRDAWRIGITPLIGSKIFNLSRKQNGLSKKRQERYYKRNIDRVEFIGQKECMCIKVEAKDHLYLTSDFIPTHNTGGVAFAIIWFICCFDNPKIVCTAPTFPTLESALWPEVTLWLNKSLVEKIFSHTSRRLYLNDSPKTWWAEPRTAKDQESMQGLHSPNMMVIADEASAIPDDIHEALDTTLTQGNNKYIMIGNPTRVSGPFFDAFHKFSKRWVNLTFNAEESPFVKKEQIEYYAEKYGIHHDLYLVNVKGEFPSGNPDAFISLSDVNEAVLRWSDVKPQGEIEIGLDVARFGDDLTVLFWRHGFKVYPPKFLPKSSSIDCAELVYKTVKDIRMSTGYEKTIKVKIDATGVGAGTADILKEDREHNIEVIECNFGGAGNERYKDEASIMWGNVKDLIGIIGLPDNTFLIEELSSRRWNMKDSGGSEKIKIEPKAEYKKEFKKSPDYADALVLCFAKKTNERAVLKSFDPLDKNVIKDNIAYIGEDKFCSVFYSKDLFVSTLFAAWDNSRLYVYDEYIGEDSIIYVATNLLNHFPLKKIVGNDRIFNDGKEDLSSRYRKFGIIIHENYMYDEAAAIDTLVNMVNQKRLIIHSRCKKTIEQLRDWKMYSTKIEQEHNFGLCYALTYILSDLKMKIRQNPEILDLSEKKIGYGVKDKSNTYRDCSWML